jgi:uncharacterized membrane protein
VETLLSSSVSLLSLVYNILFAIGGLLLILVIPGYALLSALVPAVPLSKTERAVLTPVFSIVLTILVGLVLATTPWGIQARGWGILLVALTLLLAAIGWWRQANRSAVASPKQRVELKLPQGALLGLAGIITLVALFVARTPASTTGLIGYTQLWMHPAIDRSNVVKLGVRSGEFEETAYSLQVTVNGQPYQSWPSLQLGVNQKWETDLDLSGALPMSGTIAADLYRLDQPETVYRHVLLRSDALRSNP